MIEILKFRMESRLMYVSVQKIVLISLTAIDGLTTNNRLYTTRKVSGVALSKLPACSDTLAQNVRLVTNKINL